MSTLEEPRTYGNFRKPKSYVLGNLGMLASVAVIASCVILVLIMFLIGFVQALIFGACAGSVIGLLAWKDRHGRSTLETLATHASWFKARTKGEDIYRVGIAGDGSAVALPGLLARTEVFPCTDNMLKNFGLLHHGNSNDYTVVLRANPNGYTLTDDFDLETIVDRWNKWLVRVAHEPSLRQVQVTIETRPDHGQALRREIGLQKTQFAPQVAADIMADIETSYPSGSARVLTYIALTFAGTRRGRRRGVTEMAKVLGSRLPALMKDLPSAGAGPVQALDETDLAGLVRQAYDPAAADIMAEADAAGGSGREMLTVWRAAGPMAWDEYWDHLRHDSGLSATWVVTNISGEMLATTIQPLLQAHEDIPVKRVSLFFQPRSPDQSAVLAERDKRNAGHRVRSARNPSSRAEGELVSATAVAAAEAKGAALVDFWALITATTKRTATHEPTLDDAAAAVDTLAPAVRFTHRLVYGSQATAFTLNLPLGIVAKNHSSVPTQIREGL
jgi:hypothetical protein